MSEDKKDLWACYVVQYSKSLDAQDKPPFRIATVRDLIKIGLKAMYESRDPGDWYMVFFAEKLEHAERYVKNTVEGHKEILEQIRDS